jgi:RIP metalloprotease RseP
VVALDGLSTPEWGDLVDAIGARPGEDVVLTVEREGALIEIPATLAAIDDEAGGKRGFLGITPRRDTERVGVLTGSVRAAGSVREAVALSARGMWAMFSGLGDLLSATVSGDQETLDQVRPTSPIGLVQIGATTQRFGIAFTLELVALVNVFVGLFNLIPIYPLDGGHFSVALYERIRGRPADVRKLAPVAAAVVVFMVLLGVLAVYLDIARPFRLN